MTRAPQIAASTNELTTALADPGVQLVVVSGPLDTVPTLALRPGQALLSGTQDATLRFAPDADGVQLSADNTLSGLTLQTEPGRRAVFNDLTSATMGRLVLRDLHVVGRVEIVADGAVRGGHVEADGVHIEMADAGPATCGRVA